MKKSSFCIGLLLASAACVFLVSCASAPAKIETGNLKPEIVSSRVKEGGPAAYFLVDRDFSRFNGQTRMKPVMVIDNETFTFVDDSKCNSFLGMGTVDFWGNDRLAVLALPTGAQHIDFVFGVEQIWREGNMQYDKVGARRAQFDLDLAEGKYYYFLSLEAIKPGWMSNGVAYGSFPEELKGLATSPTEEKDQEAPGLYMVVMDRNGVPESFKLLVPFVPES
jgi:hypothetical protein